MLESKELPGNYTAEHLAEAIKECLSEWEIQDSKISCVMTDNASNIVKAIDQLLKWLHLHCFGHTLNLAVKDVLAIPRVHQVVSKCSHIVTYFEGQAKLEREANCLRPLQHSMLETNSTYSISVSRRHQFVQL